MGSKKQAKSKSVRMLGHDRLEAFYARGGGEHRKKHIDKLEKNTEALASSIYSSKTCGDYHKNWNRYCDAMRDADFRVDGHRPRTLAEAAQFMPTYLKELENRPGRFGSDHLSAWTVRAYFAAPAKILSLSMKDYELPSRYQRDVQRSRGNWQAADFNPENHRDLIEFQRCVGARSEKELQKIRGTDLVYVDGNPCIHVKGKGGRERDIPIVGTEEQIQSVVGRLQAAGDALVWPKVPKHYDVHSDRAYYACRLYLSLARPAELLPREDQYRCRAEKSGLIYDRAAMRVVSLALGHSRVSVIAESYLWKIEEVQHGTV